MTFVRWFLVWLLALALPVQGFAASAMQHCGPGQGSGHHAVMGVAKGAVAPAAAATGRTETRSVSTGHLDHQHPALGGTTHGVPAVADVGTLGVTAATDVDVDHRCSACAACCAAFAFPTRTLVHAVEPARLFGALGPLADAPPFLTSGPERPPRLSSI